MIKVVASGVYTSLQDLGRFGYRKVGVPLSGAMDMQSARLANELLGNPAAATVMEFTGSGPVLEFSVSAEIAITGAVFSPSVNKKVIEMNRVVEILEGDRLDFGTHKQGIRGYLAIKRGFISEMILGSSSFYSGITAESRLKKGDILEFEWTDDVSTLTSPGTGATPPDFSTYELAVFRGPEFELLSPSLQQKLLKNSFEITSQSNRMAYVLKSEDTCSAPGIITAPVQPGTVQLTPSGKVIVLMRDAQTTGGYARILQLTNKAMDQLAQKRAGEKLFFRRVDPPFDIPV